MKTRKAARNKTGSTQRTARAVAPKRKAAKPQAGRKAAGRMAAGRASAARTAAARATVGANNGSAAQAPTVRPVALPAECLIASAAELRTTLLNRLTDAGNVQLDASAVQRIDTASLQVLAAFANDRRAGGLTVEWLDVPACLTEAASLLDLTNALGLGVPA